MRTGVFAGSHGSIEADSLKCTFVILQSKFKKTIKIQPLNSGPGFIPPFIFKLNVYIYI